MDEWLQIEGNCDKLGQTCRVSAPENNGSYEVKEGDIKFENGSAKIRRGANVSNISFPKNIDTSKRDIAFQNDTYCIGLILFRCSDDAVIGSCFGAWDCS